MCVSNLSVLGYIVSLLEISNMGNADPLLLVFLFVYIGQNYIQHPQLCQTDVTINVF